VHPTMAFRSSTRESSTMSRAAWIVGSVTVS
jgi:hypothetical protein